MKGYTHTFEDAIEVGDRVRIKDSDYTFVGVVVSRFNKRKGAVRFVVENDDGILFITSAERLAIWIGQKEMTA